MTKKWRDLYENIPTERRARIEAQIAKDLAEMPLAEVRRARELTQQQIARSLEVNQAWVSKLEHQTDMYLSTLRSFVEAMGGELEIIVRFDDGAVRLRQFEEIDREASDWVQSRSGSEQSVPNTAAERHVSIWNPPSANAWIWKAGDQAATTRSQTPSRNTPSRDKEAIAA
jgi:transcriptional regulator with XRE-family HTH domain